MPCVRPAGPNRCRGCGADLPEPCAVAGYLPDRMPRTQRPDEEQLLCSVFGDAQPRQCILQLSRCAALRRALEWLDAGAGWESHVVLEQLWRAARGAERRTTLLLSGLVHVAAAIVKGRGGHPKGAQAHAAQAIERWRQGGWDEEALELLGINLRRRRLWWRVARLDHR